MENKNKNIIERFLTDLYNNQTLNVVDTLLTYEFHKDRLFQTGSNINLAKIFYGELQPKFLQDEIAKFHESSKALYTLIPEAIKQIDSLTNINDRLELYKKLGDGDE